MRETAMQVCNVATENQVFDFVHGTESHAWFSVLQQMYDQMSPNVQVATIVVPDPAQLSTDRSCIFFMCQTYETSQLYQKLIHNEYIRNAVRSKIVNKITTRPPGRPPQTIYPSPRDPTQRFYDKDIDA